ncbi:MAG TPA: PilZ domain-containing protein, partial [Terriglobales bacterium]|nr:PilZ domain-containing protein [Terriglobales bacterium]
MSPTSANQRNTRRFALNLPLTVRTSESADATLASTRDVSSRGVFFYVDADVAEGSPIEFTLTLPPEITLTECIKVHCTGKVVRVHSSDKNSKVGIAAAIEQYDIISE